jgi:hypothetical protein
VAAEIAVSLVLLVGALLLNQTKRRPLKRGTTGIVLRYRV